jgi:hypothetical protein
MALPSNELEAVQVMLKSVSKEVHFTFKAETFSCPYPMTEICHVALSANALRAVQSRLKSVSNEEHFTLEAENVYRPCHPSH